MGNKQNDIIHANYVGSSYSNDSSAASFGWNFQYNAGIFLFLKYADSALNVEVENKYQDIVLQLKDGQHVYAQAKSAQDYTALTTGDKNTKIKDAIISLANTASKDDNGLFVFISNIKEPLVDEDGISKSRVVSYGDLNKTTRDNIDELFAAIKDKMTLDIKNIKENKRFSNESKAQKISIIERDINSLGLLFANKERFCISTIVPFKGGAERFDVIKNELDTFLERIGINANHRVSVCGKYLDFLQATFEIDSGLESSNLHKKMNTSELVWPISSILIFDNNRVSDVDHCLSFCPDPANREEMNRYLNDETFMYHTRFEFSNRVIQKYSDYRAHYKNSDSVVESFLDKHWHEYKNEFDDGKICEENLEYLTKYYLYKLISMRFDIVSIYNWLGEDRL